MHIVWEADRKYQMLTLSSVEILALRNRRITMDEDQHSYSEESIPLSLLSWFWKKKRNFASPAAKSQSRTDAWVRTVTPSCPFAPEDSARSDPEPKPQTTIHSSVPLPGSVMDFSREIQEHPSCVIKSVMLEETPEQDGEGKFWLHKIGMSINKWSLLNSLIGWDENRALEKDHQNTSGTCSDADHKLTQLEECRTKEVPYIPYKLATFYIIKIVKDMQEMKSKHLKIIRQLENTKKENQSKEQTITTINKLYGDKIRSLKSQLEAYHELMNKNSTHWQNAVKSLRERNRKLSQDKEDLIHQMKQQTEKMEEQKVSILENLTKRIKHLYTQHTLTLQELHTISLYVERVHDLVNFQIKILQQKSEKTEEEKSDVPVILKLKAEQAANEEKPECLMETEPLWQAHVMLQKIQESLQKQDREISETLESERYYKTMKPQIKVLMFLKNLAKKVHTIYCDVPEAQQYISQLIRKNKDERADQKEAFNNAQADILSYEVFYGNEPMDDKRTELSMKLFRNLGKAKSEFEYIETEKMVFDCIRTGEIPNWIKRDCLYVALADHKNICSEETSHHAEELMRKFEMEVKVANKTKEQ
ncbi:trichoplein keratin filament-binding protein-like isoform X2 [Anser cygnoides]|uniref:trichoplein keratin filament-binding protein-like isoform X2 n=1 Tax=Anser cygnoides TaxID=8845 RepID=UPI0034D204DC